MYNKNIANRNLILYTWKVVRSGKYSITVSQDRPQHSVLGEFNSNRRLINGGHGEANIDFLNQNNIEYNIVKVYDNGVRVGNIPSHKNKCVPEGGNKLGACAEPKAASVAHKNNSFITGMDTRHRLVANSTYDENSHEYTDTNKTDKSQMNPCKTCELYEKEYMEYANSSEKIGEEFEYEFGN